jgi:amino acid transporter
MQPIDQFWTSWDGIALMVVVAIGFTVLLGLINRHAYKSRLEKDPTLRRRMEIENEIRKNLPKFWTIQVVLVMIAGLALIVFGIEFFWNTSGITPQSMFWQGFGVVMLGVVVALFSFLSRALPRAREIDRRRRAEYERM